MADNSPHCSTTVAILLAATEFPSHAEFASRRQQNAAFGVSLRAVQAYLERTGVPPEHVLVLENLPEAPHEQLARMSAFFRQCCQQAEAENRDLRDLLFYFVGHGGGKQQDYHLYLAASNPDYLRQTTLGVRELMTELSRTLRGAATDFGLFLRQYYIIDACYSAQAYHAATTISSGAKSRRRQQHPSRGMTLLCSSNSDEHSWTPASGEMTLFTQAMLELLDEPDEEGRQTLASLGEALSFQQLAAMLARRLESRWDNDRSAPPLPQVYSPVTIEGDLQHVPFFPNPLRQDGRGQPAAPPKPRGRMDKIRRAIRRRAVLLCCLLGLGLLAVTLRTIGRPARIEYIEAVSPDPVEYLPPEEVVLKPPRFEPQEVEFIVMNKTDAPIEVLMVNAWRYYNRSDNPMESPSYRFYCELDARTGCLERSFKLGTGWYVFYARRVDSLRWVPYRVGERNEGAKNIFGNKFVVLEIFDSPTDRLDVPYVWSFHESENVIEECNDDETQHGQPDEA